MRTRRLLAVVAAALGAALGAGPATAAAPPAPRLLEIDTNPATPGLKLVYHGHTYSADAHGHAVIDVSATPVTADPRLEVTVRPRLVTSDRRVRFGRWLGNQRRAVAALETERRVAWTFVDLTGRPVDVHLVQRLVLRAITGEVTTYTGDDLTKPHWLLAQRIVPRTAGLEAKDLYYSVQAIDVLRSNVVNASQQRFVPTSSQQLTFRLSFYPLSLRAEDVLFGRPAGSSAKVEFPDGHVEQVPLDHGVIELGALPRGSYYVTVQGGAFSFRTPVSVSKPQNAVFPVVTYLDVALVAGVMTLLALGLLLIGRPSLATRPLRAARRLRDAGRAVAGRARTGTGTATATSTEGEEAT